MPHTPAHKPTPATAHKPAPAKKFVQPTPHPSHIAHAAHAAHPGGQGAGPGPRRLPTTPFIQPGRQWWSYFSPAEGGSPRVLFGAAAVLAVGGVVYFDPFGWRVRDVRGAMARARAEAERKQVGGRE
jgi:hypothetical protein